MKISIIGAGNVGSTLAMRIAQEDLGNIALIDIAPGLAAAKQFDIDDSRNILKADFNIKGSENIGDIHGSQIVVITAGLTRKPGMTREDLLLKNAQIIKNLSLEIKNSAPKAIVIVVTNPLDSMTYLCLKTTLFKSSHVFGMGASLDAARFANLISQELKVASSDIEAMVIGSHGETMLVLPRFTNIKETTLDKTTTSSKVEELVKRTKLRGQEIVSLLGSGSAYFAPSASIAELIRAIHFNQKRTLPVSAYLNGEYGIKDLCIGVPCVIGENGIEEIIELNLHSHEKAELQKSSLSLAEINKRIVN
ncbi:MAG: malate dehydrogenase [Candidatus Omnitrophota bacterium]|nr:malate dehydrogenase [Candidatus Omnitrophota bacterium]